MKQLDFKVKIKDLFSQVENEHNIRFKLTNEGNIVVYCERADAFGTPYWDELWGPSISARTQQQIYGEGIKLLMQKAQ